jgi:hypothetical protein
MPGMRGGFATALLLGLGLGAPLVADEPSPAPVPAVAHKSVRGTLQGVDKTARGVRMTTDDGKQVAWRFGSAVIAEVAKLPAGAPMIVIYRQTASNEKRVTAVAFPGTASKPTYVNLTGERIVFRSAAMVGDSCTTPAEGPVNESIVPDGGRAEVDAGCWCCAPFGNACTPGNKSGAGLAYLDRCFE